MCRRVHYDDNHYTMGTLIRCNCVQTICIRSIINLIWILSVLLQNYISQIIYLYIYLTYMYLKLRTSNLCTSKFIYFKSKIPQNNILQNYVPSYLLILCVPQITYKILRYILMYLHSYPYYTYLKLCASSYCISKICVSNLPTYFLCHHHHQVVPPVRISLTLSRHFSLSFIASGRFSGLHPVSSHSCCM